MKEIKLDPIYDSIILLSDVHFGVHVNSIEWNDNILNYFNHFFIPYVKEYKKNHTPILIIAGDFFEENAFRLRYCIQQVADFEGCYHGRYCKYGVYGIVLLCDGKA